MAEYDLQRVIDTIEAQATKAAMYEELADELREKADEWDRLAADCTARAIELGERLRRDGYAAHNDGEVS